MDKQRTNKKKKQPLLLCLSVFMNVMLMAASVSAADLEDIKKSNVLRHLGIPYANFVTGSGDGMDVEIIKLFAASIGVRYQYVMTDWDKVFGELTGKKVIPKGTEVEFLENVPIKGDLIANGVTVLPWRQKVVEFSHPTFPNQVWLVARSDSPLKPIKPSKNTAKDIEAVKALLKNRTLLSKAGTCLDAPLYDPMVADILIFMETVCSAADALEICKFTTNWLAGPLGLSAMAKLVSLATGLTITAEKLIEIVERGWQIERAFSVREGISARDDMPSARFFEPIPSGPHKGKSLDRDKFATLLQVYYEKRGWDKNGIPTREKLESLDLKDVADSLGL